MTSGLAYFITVSKAHLLPAQNLLETLRRKTDALIVVAGNLEQEGVRCLQAYGVKYLDENEIDLKGRAPRVGWTEKFRQWGWYKQMFLRLSIDRFMDAEQVVILDSEVFVFKNWDESRFYDPKTKRPRSFYWVPRIRKPDWDYAMYRGAAFLLSFLPDCEGIMEYANSDHYRRHISGVVLFSTRNVARLWQLLESNTDLPANMDRLFNREAALASSDHDFYGLGVEYGLFQDAVPTIMHNQLLGWYDTHQDPVFEPFRKDAMWSMCQRYAQFPTQAEYRNFMTDTAEALGQELPLPG